MNSISPVYSEELVPPSVNAPPGMLASVDDVERVSQKLISGESNCPLVASVCQKGVDPVAERGAKARPRKPATGG